MDALTWGQILTRIATQFLPVWAGLIAAYVLSIRTRKHTGLYGKLFDSPVGMIGFGIVMFWVFTAVFADLVITHDPLAQFSGSKNAVPGSVMKNPDDGAYPYFLFGADHVARDVFSRMVMGAREVLKIAPAATVFAFMVGVTLGLPAGYFGGKLDTVLSFLANLVLAFPVILLFYLLVTPEIVKTGIPQRFAAVLFLFPIVFFVILFNSRFRTNPTRRNIYVGVTLVLGLWAYSGLAFNADPLGLFRMDPNLLNVFVSVVFVNSPGVFRIVRGMVMDIKTRDYVAAGQTRGEGPWYIMLWEILPNARGPLIVDFCLRIGYTTILLGTLGFFGLGVSPESPDWGSTIDDGRKLLSIVPPPRPGAGPGPDEPGPRPQPSGRRPARRKPERLMPALPLHLSENIPEGSGERISPASPPHSKRKVSHDSLGPQPTDPRNRKPVDFLLHPCP